MKFNANSVIHLFVSTSLMPADAYHTAQFQLRFEM